MRTEKEIQSDTGQQTIDAARKERMGFLHLDEIELIAADPATRLQYILVRCGCGRFAAPAQDVIHFIRIIERDAKAAALNVSIDNPNWMDSDYIRDCSVSIATPHSAT